MTKILMVSSFMFFVGVLGLFFTSRHIILLLLSIELMFLSMNYNFFIFSLYLDDIMGQFFVLCMISVAAAESVIGLAMLVIFYSLRGGISLDLMNLLKG